MANGTFSYARKQKLLVKLQNALALASEAVDQLKDLEGHADDPNFDEMAEIENFIFQADMETSNLASAVEVSADAERMAGK